MNGKSVLKTLGVLALIVSFLIPLAVPTTASPAEPDEWYMSVEGVLTSDYYSLYPYAKKSLDIGFSQFGEMIRWWEGPNIGLGIQYPGKDSAGHYDQRLSPYPRDPFANEAIPTKSWLNGWFIDVTYRHILWGPREVWAFALFSDGLTPGGNWQHMATIADKYDEKRPLWQEYPPYADPGGSPTGGRKTNGWCETDPIVVLYDGPRRFVAVTKTRIYDYDEKSKGKEPLVDLYITIVFNKVEKNVILLKDLKRINPKYSLNIQFGNRGEWDLGSKADGYASYVHFYTDHPVKQWDVEKQEPAVPYADIYPVNEFFREWMVENKYPKKWFRNETQYTTYGVDPGHEWHVDTEIVNHGYAVAQVISKDKKYVGAHAVWPAPEFWSVQRTILNPGPEAYGEEINLMLAPISRMLNWEKWLNHPGDPASPLEPEGKLPDRDNLWIQIDDMQTPYKEADIPWIIYEHDFMLSGATYDYYRVVSVYALTDNTDGDDANMGAGHVNRIDREIQYQLDEIFNSWDIYSALNKYAKRWVGFGEGDGDSTYFYMTDWLLDWEDEAGVCVRKLPMLGYFPRSIYIDDERLDLHGLLGGWDAYCSFAERILVDGVLQVPMRETKDGDPTLDDLTDALWGVTGLFKGPRAKTTYSYYLDPFDGEIEFIKAPPDGAEIKVLWSSPDYATKGEEWLTPYITWENEYPLHHRTLKTVAQKWIDEFIEEYAGDEARYIDWSWWWWMGPAGPWPLAEVFYVSPGEGSVYQLAWGDWVWSGATYFGWDYDMVTLQDKLKKDEWLNVTYRYYDGDTGSSYPNTELFQLEDALDFPIGTEFALSPPYEDPDDPENAVESIISVEKPYQFEFIVPIENLTIWEEAIEELGFVIISEIAYDGYVEIEFLVRTRPLVQGEWVIHETETCDELVLNWWECMEGGKYAELKIVYKVLSGRYEWGAVGVNSRAIDSAGMGMVTAAIKNKNLEFGKTALDMQDTEWGPEVPYLLRDLGELSDYRQGATYDWYDDMGRLALRDDWCHGADPSAPVSSANIITVGGGPANLVSEYFNDFSEAIMVYGLAAPSIMSDIYEDTIFLVTCWAPFDSDTHDRIYSPEYEDGVQTLGYAVVTTYKDKNGTVGLMIYGYTGQDTYYACKWFDYNKFALQHINQHVTTLLLKIDYTTHPPTVEIIESLGTISEKPQHDC